LADCGHFYIPIFFAPALAVVHNVKHFRLTPFLRHAIVHDMTTDPRTHKALTAQIRRELGDMASQVGYVLGDDLLVQMEQRVDELAPVLAERLLQDEDDELGQTAAGQLLPVLWPGCGPEDAGEAEWWSTPLGRACARHISGRDGTEAVSHSVAAAMLGVTRGTVAQLVHRGTLDRHPDGGVLRLSVLQRLAR